VRAGLGADVGFFAGWTLLAVGIIFVAGLIIAAAFLLQALCSPDLLNIGFMADQWVWTAVALAMIVLGISYVGVNITARVLLTLTTVGVGLLLVFGFIVLAKGGAHGLAWTTFSPERIVDVGFANFAIAVGIAMTAFGGFETALFLAQEAHAPRRQVPQAVIGAVLVALVFYVFISFTILSGYGVKHAGGWSKDGPFAVITLAFNGFVPVWYGKLLLGILAVSSAVSALGTANFTTRIAYSWGRDGYLPRAFSRTHPRFRTPHVAIGALALVTAVVFAAGSAWKGQSLQAFAGFTVFSWLLLAGAAAVLPVYPAEPGIQSADIIEPDVVVWASGRRLGSMHTEAPARDHLIGGEPAASADGRTFSSIDPATAEPIATVALGGAEDVDRAVRAAREAHPAWVAMAPLDRTRLILRLAELIERDSDELAELESRDVGKPIREARGRDLPTVVATWLYWAGWPARSHGSTPPADPGVFTYTLREPLGVVGAITPWNFPLVIASWKLAPALACGNTVVHKPAEESPLSALRLAELALEAGFPPGVWNVVTGDAEAGAELAGHEDVDKLSFTGSTETGRAIQRAATSNLKRLTLELGGKSANVVLDDADLDAAIEGAVRATFRNAGQVCTAGGRLVVDQRLVDPLVEGLAGRVGAMKVGAPQDPSTDIGPLVSRGQRDHVLDLYRAAAAEGARPVLGGGPASVDELPHGFFVQPSIFVETRPEMRINREEIFGPAVAVIRVADEDEAVRVANDTRYGLAAAVWSRDGARAHRVARALRAGTVWVNMYGGLDPYAPYGGRGLSGYGYELGPEAAEEYTQLKTVRNAI
jgi:acyl-CoA reductase-like NAD-dependent aldehyde dehydrogenase